jgi:hypothetical protein
MSIAFKYRIRNKNISDEISIALVLQVTLMLVKNMLVNSNSVFYVYNEKLNLILFVIIVFMYLRIFILYHKKIKLNMKSIMILLLITMFFLITLATNNNLLKYSYLISALGGFAVYSLPPLILLPMVHNTDTLLKYFYKTSYYAFVFATLSFVLFYTTSKTGVISDYSMSYGKAVMIPCLFLFSKAFSEKKIYDYVLAILCVIFIILVGSRYPLLCIVSFIAIQIIRHSKSTKKIFAAFALLASGSFLYAYMSHIATILFSFLVNLGLYSRTLRLIMGGIITSDSGRGQLHAQLIERINESPIIGYGFGGGYVALNDGLPHGLLLDIFANFGYLFGSIFIYLMITSIFKAYKYSKSNSFRELIVVFLCLFLPIATIGGGLWATDKLWWVIALCIFSSKQTFNRNIQNYFKNNRGFVA